MSMVRLYIASFVYLNVCTVGLKWLCLIRTRTIKEQNRISGNRLNEFTLVYQSLLFPFNVHVNALMSFFRFFFPFLNMTLLLIVIVNKEFVRKKNTRFICRLSVKLQYILYIKHNTNINICVSKQTMLDFRQQGRNITWDANN